MCVCLSVCLCVCKLVTRCQSQKCQSQIWNVSHKTSLITHPIIMLVPNSKCQSHTLMLNTILKCQSQIQNVSHKPLCQSQTLMLVTNHYVSHTPLPKFGMLVTNLKCQSQKLINHKPYHNVSPKFEMLVTHPNVSHKFKMLVTQLFISHKQVCQSNTLLLVTILKCQSHLLWLVSPELNQYPKIEVLKLGAPVAESVKCQQLQPKMSWNQVQSYAKPFLHVLYSYSASVNNIRLCD